MNATQSFRSPTPTLAWIVIIPILVFFLWLSGMEYAPANPGDHLGALLIWIPSAAALYLWPSIVLAGTLHPHKKQIVALNLLAGWSVIGWLAAAIWAYMPGSGGATKRCPFCAETVQVAAVKCKHCGSALGVSAATGEQS